MDWEPSLVEHLKHKQFMMSVFNTQTNCCLSLRPKYAVQQNTMCGLPYPTELHYHFPVQHIWLKGSVSCMFGHKKIYKVTNLKVHSKGRYFMYKKNPFQELQRTARLDYKVVLLYLWHHKDKSRLLKFDWLAGEENAWLSFAHFNTETLVFLYHCISDGYQLFTENVGCHFHSILDIMSDKAAFVSGALLCVALPGKSRSFRYNSASCWQIINLIYICRHK